MSRTIHGQSHKALKYFRKQPAALSIYWTYVSRMNNEGVAWPSLDRLGDDIDWSKNSCHQGRKLLVELQALERVENYIRPAWRNLPEAELKLKLSLDRSEYYRPTGYIMVNDKKIMLLYNGGDEPSSVDQQSDDGSSGRPSMASTVDGVDGGQDEPELDLTSHLDSTSQLNSTRTENKDSSPVGGLPQSIPEIASGLEGGKPSDGEQAGEGDSKPIQSLEGKAQNGAALPDPKPPVPVAPLSPTEGQGDKKPRPKNPLQEAVAYAFSTTTGPFAGQLGSMLTGTATKGQWKEWAITEPPMTPAEIWGARLWYNAEPRYKEQSKNGLPRTAETLHTRILEYRSSPKHAEFLRRAENLLAAHLGQDTAELDDTDFQHLFPPPAETDGIPYTGQPSNIDLKAWKAEYEQQKEGAV